MTGRGKLIAGPTLILMGVLLLAGHSVHWQTFGVVWLFLFLGLGVALLALYAQGSRHPSILSGGVLVTLLAFHLLALRWGWVSFDSSWPFFLLAPGIALLAVASSDRGNKDALTPAIVLIAAAVFCYLFTLGIFALLFRLALGVVRFSVKYVLPIILIGWGVWLLLDRRADDVATATGAVPPAPDAPEKIEVDEIVVEDPVTGEQEVVITVSETVEPFEEAEFEDEVGDAEASAEVLDEVENVDEPSDDDSGPRFT